MTISLTGDQRLAIPRASVLLCDVAIGCFGQQDPVLARFGTELAIHSKGLVGRSYCTTILECISQSCMQLQYPTQPLIRSYQEEGDRSDLCATDHSITVAIASTANLD